ncbi:NADAR family protein [Rodentibacter heidelbergensis]|uniref:Swarming motility protein YbiA n=1 Tax=Rodentibacter heidelbergensis TaxID=1908258 RepID=A0A1V3I7P1_9PAST|nr:NADAR family protein [Rodentibacter heidelbergensis]OOF35552.1 swarming motility protein YbiA [Rodentibacter heidelbergensis]
MNEIMFYKVNDLYGEFSNFSPYGFILDKKYWATVEHYFQAQKFFDLTLQEKIRSMDSPMKAAIEGRKKENPLRPDWDKVKDQIMYKAVKAKFTQNIKLLNLLLSTGSKNLIEHTPNDSYWADGGNGRGKNMLGTILMKVRDELFLENKI